MISEINYGKMNKNNSVLDSDQAIITTWDNASRRGTAKLNDGSLSIIRKETVLKRGNSPKIIDFKPGKVVNFVRKVRLLEVDGKKTSSSGKTESLEIIFELFGIIDPETVTPQDQKEIDDYWKPREKRTVAVFNRRTREHRGDLEWHKVTAQYTFDDETEEAESSEK